MRRKYLYKLAGVLLFGLHVFSPLFTYQIIYQYGTTDFYFIFCVIIYNCIIYFVVLIFPALAFGSSFRWVPPSLQHVSVILFLNTHLLSGTVKWFGLILCIPCPNSRIIHFFKDFWFLLLENAIRNQDLGAGFDCWYWGIIASRTELIG